MIKTLETVNNEIASIDSRIKTITERPFKNEEYEIYREEIVNQLMDKRDDLVKQRTELERRNK